ncbi:MAG: Uncharacterized protein K0R84_2523 [Clostridia bacterium]|jgi:hypothetical protein|nr:Uncharacterized protein [Clostridia bacterium]
MIIDEKGKLFGKINVIDLLAILVLVLIAAGVVYKFGYTDNRGVGNDSLIQYTASIKDIRSYTAEAISVGDSIYDSKTGTYMGKVIGKELQPYKDYITKTDGTVSLAEKPDRFELLITMEVPGVVNSYSYLASGNRDVNNQSTVFLENRLATVQGKVVDVRKIR